MAAARTVVRGNTNGLHESTYTLRVRLDCEENQGLVPVRVVPRHLWCHPDVPRRIENVRKMFALFKTQFPDLTRGLLTTDPGYMYM